MSRVCLLLLLASLSHANAQALPQSIQERVAALRAQAATNAISLTNRPAVTNITIGWRYSGTNLDVVVYGAPSLAGPWSIEAILPAAQTNLTLPVTNRAHFWLVSGYDPIGVGLMNPEPARLLK